MVSRQEGVSLIELLVALAVSAIAASAMVLLFAVTVGASTDTVESSRLNEELRGAMQVITRDLRRAQYSDAYMQSLLKGDDLSQQPTPLQVSGGCIDYSYERGGNDIFGAFRLTESNGIGTLEISTDDDGCSTADDGWAALTDSNIVDIESFNITQPDSYVQEISTDLAISQQVCKFIIELEGRLIQCRVLDANGDCVVSRTLRDSVRVRNDLLITTPTAWTACG